MGDRCFMTVTVRKEHIERFYRILPRDFADDISEDELTVTMEYQQANYGHGSELGDAAEAGCEFYGHHDAGSSYEAAEFYSEGHSGIHFIYRGVDGCGVVVDGDTPDQRRDNLRRIEVRLSARDDLILRMHNPIYDLTKETA